VNVPYECITWVYEPLAVVAVTFWPASIITTVPHVFVRGLTIASGSATEFPRIVVISIARPGLELAPVIITIAVAGAAAAPALAVAIAFLVARIIVTRVEVHAAALR
jgi:hypothetical protein